MLNSLAKKLDRVGPFWFAVIVAALIGNAYFLARALIATWDLSAAAILDAEGFIRGNDVVALWTAADMALGGEAEAAYDLAAIQAAQRQLTGTENLGLMAWLYPPTYLLMMLPFGLPPYFPALALWQAVPLLGFLLVMARMGLPPLLYWLLPLSAAVVQSVVSGQNGLLSALLLAGGFLCLERRPRLAGVLFALMTFKPQLALLIAPALAVERRWQALGAMVATIAALVAVSLAAFGTGPWIAFFGNLSYVQDQVALGHVLWKRMPTVFVAARALDLDVATAQVLQGLLAIAVLAGVAWAWWRPVPFRLKAALLVAAIPLVTPYAYDYDLVILLLPIAWLIAAARQDPLGFWEVGIMVLAWMLPAWWVKLLIEGTGVPIGPVILLAFYAVILNRARRARGVALADDP